MVDLVLDRYLKRVHTGRGSRLTHSMKSSLRSYPNIPEIVRRSARLIWEYEELMRALGGHRYMRPMQLYKTLVATQDDWVKELPVAQKPSLIEIVMRLCESDADQEVEGVPPEDNALFGGLVQFHRTPIQGKLCLHSFPAAMSVARHIGVFVGHGRVALAGDFREAIRLAQVG